MPLSPGRSGDSRTRPLAWSTMPEMPATTAWIVPGPTVWAEGVDQGDQVVDECIRVGGSRTGRAILAPSCPPRLATVARSVRPPASMPTTNAERTSSSTIRGGRPTPLASSGSSRSRPWRRSRATARPTVAADRPVAAASSEREARGRSASNSRIATVGSAIRFTESGMRRRSRTGCTKGATRIPQHRLDRSAGMLSSRLIEIASLGTAGTITGGDVLGSSGTCGAPVGGPGNPDWAPPVVPRTAGRVQGGG